MIDLADLARLAEGAPREDLPTFLGKLAEAEARCRLRLAEAPAPAQVPAVRFIGADEAAAIAGVSKRTILARTRGLAFRHDLSRKAARFDEAGLRQWLMERRAS